MVSYVYEGFGKIVGQNGGGGGPYQFCGLWGYRNDYDAGLIHVGARYYEFETGRWVQKDPIISMNAYYYVANNPIMRIDLSGYDWTDWIKKLSITAIVFIIYEGWVHYAHHKVEKTLLQIIAF